MTDDQRTFARSPYLSGLWPLSALIIVLMVAIGASVIWILSVARTEVQDRIGSSLTAVLNTVHKAVQIWADQTEIDASILAESRELRPLVMLQLQAKRSSLNTSALKEIRRELGPAIEKHGYLGFFIIAPDGITIAAQTDGALGHNDIKVKEPLLISAALSGKADLGLPFDSSVNAENETINRKVIDVAAPILDDGKRVIALLVLRLDTAKDFTQAAGLGRIGQTGETYVFAHSGLLLSDSRFNNELEKAELLPSSEVVRSAITGTAGTNLKGYPDYRGVPVVGSWLWDQRLGMGFATEMDFSEAYHPYDVSRSLILFLLLIVAGIAVFLLLVLQHRSRLIAANVGIRESVRAREDLMAIVAHDLRNPLSAIILRSKIASEKLPPCTSTDFVKGTLDRINQTARHMNQLVGDLNLAAQFEAGRLRVELQPCYFKQAIEPVIERLGFLAQEKEITLKIKDEQAGGEILSADLTRLSQILSNLIGNAIKFTPKGGTVSIAAENRDDEVLFRIEDTGPGIDPEALPHIFDKFWQARTTGSGMGLGLFITKLLVEAHHGRIWISSSPGVGTTFHFTIPKSRV